MRNTEIPCSEATKKNDLAALIQTAIEADSMAPESLDTQGITAQLRQMQKQIADLTISPRINIVNDNNRHSTNYSVDPSPPPPTVIYRDAQHSQDQYHDIRNDYSGGNNDYARGGYRNEARGGYNIYARGGYRNARCGYRNNERQEYKTDTTGGYMNDTTGGYRNDTRGGYRGNVSMCLMIHA
jgi:hypothetical protein